MPWRSVLTGGGSGPVRACACLLSCTVAFVRSVIGHRVALTVICATVSTGGWMPPVRCVHHRLRRFPGEEGRRGYVAPSGHATCCCVRFPAARSSRVRCIAVPPACALLRGVVCAGQNVCANCVVGRARASRCGWRGSGWGGGVRYGAFMGLSCTGLEPSPSESLSWD